MTETGKLDLITFEVLRHRLWEINDEMAMLAARISGSPAVYESNDFNAAILTASGEGLFTGWPLKRVGKAMKYDGKRFPGQATLVRYEEPVTTTA